MNVQRLLRKNIRKLKAYNVKEVSCRVKLDANESPYSFPSFLNKIKTISTNRYPDPEGKELKRAAAGRWRLKAKNILLGNGSDEIIYYLITTFGGPVLFPTPTFSMFSIIAQALGEEAIEVPLDGSFDLDTGKMIKAVKTYRPKLIFLSSPNNPTGNCFSSERIYKIMKASRGIVVIDEAYQPFVSKSDMLPLFNDFENISFMRTLSKIGFASLRVGFLIAREEMIEAVNRVRLPFNVNALSQAVAIEIFKDYKVIEKTLMTICKERDRLFKELKKIEGITPYPSEANFLLFRVKNASLVHKRLLSRGVLIRDMHSTLKDCLRITVGSPEENSIFLDTLKEILQWEKRPLPYSQFYPTRLL